MNITVLTGSPHRKGTSNLLAEEFIRGVIEAGHHVERFDAAFLEVHPCIGCDRCQQEDKTCVFHEDDFAKISESVVRADVITYASPLYYHNVTAQLKTVIDRYHGIDDELRRKNKYVISLITGANPNTWIFNGLKANVQTTCRYLGWTDLGGIYANGCFERADIEKTDFPRKAYELGKNVEGMVQA